MSTNVEYTQDCYESWEEEVISKDWATIKDLMEQIGLKGGIKLIGGRKELWCYKQEEPSNHLNKIMKYQENIQIV